MKSMGVARDTLTEMSLKSAIETLTKGNLILSSGPMPQPMHVAQTT